MPQRDSRKSWVQVRQSYRYTDGASLHIGISVPHPALWPAVHREHLRALPAVSGGVYILWPIGDDAKPYVGETQDLHQRLADHRRERRWTYSSFLFVDDERDRRILEAAIQAHLEELLLPPGVERAERDLVDELDRKILRVINRRTVPLREVVEELDRPYGTINRRLQRLVRLGFARRPRWGAYRATELGQSEASSVAPKDVADILGEE